MYTKKSLFKTLSWFLKHIFDNDNYYTNMCFAIFIASDWQNISFGDTSLYKFIMNFVREHVLYKYNSIIIQPLLSGKYGKYINYKKSWIAII